MTDEAKKEIPSIDIRIDKEGVWYYQGNEMFRKEILELFYQSLERDESGRYLVKNNNQAFYIEVEDTPYTVKSVEFSGNEMEGTACLKILLSDGSVETLDPATLRMGEENVLYCSVKNSGFEARFTRQGYYQFAEYIQYDGENNRYFIRLNDRLYDLSMR